MHAFVVLRKGVSSFHVDIMRDHMCPCKRVLQDLAIAHMKIQPGL